MKKISLKTPLLALVIAISTFSVTACKDSGQTQAPINKKVNPNLEAIAQTFASIATLQKGFDSEVSDTQFNAIKDHVAAETHSDIAGWIKGYSEAKDATGAVGVAGKFVEKTDTKPRTVILSENGFEYNQLVKKGLIGAYQLNNVNAEVAKLGTQDNQTTLENVTTLLLGSYGALTEADRFTKPAGNEFKKYLVKYPNLTNALYDALQSAKTNKSNNAKFEKDIKNAVAIAQETVATRAAHYFNSGAEGLGGASSFEDAAHGASEGLGLLYSLQFTDKYTKEDVNSFLSDLDLHDKASAKEKLEAKAKELTDTFYVGTAGKFVAISELQGGFKTDVAATKFEMLKYFVAADTSNDIAGWIQGYTDAKNAKASEGVAGAMGSRILNAKGLEYNQLVKKGLIGAYQFSNVSTVIAANKDDAKTLEKVSMLLLGSSDLDTTDRFTKPAGNEFKKYLVKYSNLTNELYDTLKDAESKVGTEDFKDAIVAAERVAHKALAVRTAHYLRAADKFETDFESAVHGISEGLGMVYALQFSSEYTKEDVNAFLKSLNLYKKDAQTLNDKAASIETKFGITAEDKVEK